MPEVNKNYTYIYIYIYNWEKHTTVNISKVYSSIQSDTTTILIMGK